MRHFSPEPLPQLGWGQFHHAHCWEPYSWPSRAKAVANAPPGTLLHGQPPCRPAPTLRDETVARSMSGELAIILWAVRTPAGDRVPPSSPVLAPPPHSQEGSRTPTTQGKTPHILGLPLPTGTLSRPLPPPSRRQTGQGHPQALGPLLATGPTCRCEALGQGKGQLAGPNEAHAHGVGGAPTTLAAGTGGDGAGSSARS